MEAGKHDILKKINDADIKHKQLKQEVLDMLDQIKVLEEAINNKLEEIDILERDYVGLMGKLME